MANKRLGFPVCIVPLCVLEYSAYVCVYVCLNVNVCVKCLSVQISKQSVCNECKHVRIRLKQIVPKCFVKNRVCSAVLGCVYCWLEPIAHRGA